MAKGKGQWHCAHVIPGKFSKLLVISRLGGANYDATLKVLLPILDVSELK